MVGNTLAVPDQIGAEEMSCGAGIEVVGLYARIVSPPREGMGHPALKPVVIECFAYPTRSFSLSSNIS